MSASSTENVKARDYDAKVVALVTTERGSMATLAYTLLEMRNEGMHRALGEPTIAAYAVTRGVTRSRAHARELILVAERVVRWPVLKAAFERGELDWTKLRDGLRVLERTGGTPRDEERWLKIILESSSRAVEEEVARSRGERSAVTQVFRHSRERQARLQHALQLARSRGSGRETDAEALARIVEDWIAGTTHGPTRPGTTGHEVSHLERRDGAGATAAAPANAAPPLPSVNRSVTLEARPGETDPDPCAGRVPTRSPENRATPLPVGQCVFAGDAGACRERGCEEAGFHVHHDAGWQRVAEGRLEIGLAGSEVRIRLGDGWIPIESRRPLADWATKTSTGDGGCRGTRAALDQRPSRRGDDTSREAPSDDLLIAAPATTAALAPEQRPANAG